jgi:hypothetical protein
VRRLRARGAAARRRTGGRHPRPARSDSPVEHIDHAGQRAYPNAPRTRTRALQATPPPRTDRDRNRRDDHDARADHHDDGAGQYWADDDPGHAPPRDDDNDLDADDDHAPHDHHHDRDDDHPSAYDNPLQYDIVIDDLQPIRMHVI